MKAIIATVAIFGMVWALTGCSQPGASGAKAGDISEEELGLRTASLYEERVVLDQAIEYSGAAPGMAGVLPRSFENAPPMIPHSVDGLIPVTMNNNSCIGCHMPEVASMVGAVAIPTSHMFDLRADKDLGGKLSGTRYSCTQCHAPQVDRQPAVETRFEAAWRTREGLSQSNLMDVLKEGVR